MTKHAIRPELREVKTALAQVDLPHSLRARLTQQAARRRSALRAFRWTVAGVALAAAVLILWLPRRPTDSVRHAAHRSRKVAPPALKADLNAEPSTGRTAERPAGSSSEEYQPEEYQLGGARGAITLRPGAPEMRLAQGEYALNTKTLSAELTALAPSRVRATLRGLRLVSGRVQLDVEPKTQELIEAQPVRLLVSHGTIELVSAKASIHQFSTGGQVSVQEGVLWFTPKGGTPSVISGRLSWPNKTPLAPTAPSTSEPGFETESLLRAVAEHRSQGAYKEAAALLNDALKRAQGDTGALLSFELGSILTYQLNDSPKACAHWAQHIKRFAGVSRYGEEIRLAQAHLRCLKESE